MNGKLCVRNILSKFIVARIIYCSAAYSKCSSDKKQPAILLVNYKQKEEEGLEAQN
jgi:hypothetical protein